MSVAQDGPARSVAIRPLGRAGDLGWVVRAHGELYDREYGWNTDFEALVTRIVADFADGRGSDRQAGWVAEVDGERAGCVLCVAGADEREARLRLLLVTPTARGLGLGSRLVAECVDFARRAGYRELTLWTNDVLASARRIYQAAGFGLVAEEAHADFGPPLVGQHWRLDLDS